MTYTATLHYTKSIVQDAVFQFWWRSVGTTFLIVLLLVMVAFAWLISEGAQGWLVGFLGASLLFALIVIVALFVIHYRSSIQKLRALAGAGVVFTASDDTFTFSTPDASSTLPWSSVQPLWKYKRLWLLMYSKAQYATLPLADMPVDMRAFIEARVDSRTASPLKDK